MNRHIQGDAVIGLARREAVMQGQTVAAEHVIVGKQGNTALLGQHQIAALPQQTLLFRFRQGAEPFIERFRATDFGRYPIQIPAFLPVRIDHQSAAALFGFLVMRFGQHLQIA